MRALAVPLIPLLAACTVVGNGQQTLVPARVPVADTNSGFVSYFPDLVYDNSQPQLSRLRAMTPESTTHRSKFTKHLQEKLGSTTAKSLVMSLVVRDRTTIPPFLPTDIDLDKSLLAIYLNKDLTDVQIDMLSEKAKARILNVPDLPRRTAVHEGQRNEFVYFYYPRVKLEFSSKIQSPSYLDRISYLGVVIDLKPVDSPAAEKFLDKLLKGKDQKIKDNAVSERNRTCAVLKDRFRLVDFEPKDADIVEFTRGQLTQAATLQAKTTFSAKDIDKITSSVTRGSAPDASTSGSDQTAESAISPELAATFSETFVNALKDSIDARTAGFLNDGQTFFADFRSIKERRIGGTYDFDLMLEVPAFSYREASLPCGDLEASAYLIGVVRHVYDRGFTGRWQKVPEPENDDAFFEVVTQHISTIKVWQFDGQAWVNAPVSSAKQFVVTVITNDADAQFVVRQKSNQQILGSGSGKSTHIAITTLGDSARVEFLDINRTHEEHHHTLSAVASGYFDVPEDKSGKQTVIGNYQRTPSSVIGETNE